MEFNVQIKQITRYLVLFAHSSVKDSHAAATQIIPQTMKNLYPAIK